MSGWVWAGMVGAEAAGFAERDKAHKTQPNPSSSPRSSAFSETPRPPRPPTHALLTDSSAADRPFCKHVFDLLG
jgi:hypothetical protein